MKSELLLTNHNDSWAVRKGNKTNMELSLIERAKDG